MPRTVIREPSMRILWPHTPGVFTNIESSVGDISPFLLQTDKSPSDSALLDSSPLEAYARRVAWWHLISYSRQNRYIVGPLGGRSKWS
jgi:hypothetical protein